MLLLVYSVHFLTAAFALHWVSVPAITGSNSGSSNGLGLSAMALSLSH